MGGRCRRWLLIPVVVTNRIVLFCLGFWWIRIKDHRKKPRERPKLIVAAPHTAFVDALVLAWAFPIWPGAVAKKELLSVPIFGSVGKAAQGIYVDRKSEDSKNACKEAIAARASSEWTGGPLLIFPEGTTTNAKVLIQFKVGPFGPGEPVLPVLLRYPARHFDISWVDRNANLGLLMLRMMTQFANFCTIEICEAYSPSEAERSNPKLFTNNVRTEMADRLGIPTTEHSYDDVFLSFEAAKVGVGSDFLVRDFAEKYKFDFSDLKWLLQRFKAIDKDNTGQINFQTFCDALTSGPVQDGKAQPSKESLETLFSFFDTDDSGHIGYREFVQYASLLSGRCSSTSRAKLAFLMYDVEGKGAVRCATLSDALDSSLLFVSDDTAQPGVIGKAEIQSPGATLLQSIGKGKEDTITFEEFVTVVDSRPDVLEAGLQLARDRLGMPELGRQIATE